MGGVVSSIAKPLGLGPKEPSAPASAPASAPVAAPASAPVAAPKAAESAKATTEETKLAANTRARRRMGTRLLFSQERSAGLGKSNDIGRRCRPRSKYFSVRRKPWAAYLVHHQYQHHHHHRHRIQRSRPINKNKKSAWHHRRKRNKIVSGQLSAPVKPAVCVCFLVKNVKIQLWALCLRHWDQAAPTQWGANHAESL